MSQAIQRMFSGFSWSNLWTLIDLRKRLVFTFFMLFIYRFGAKLPIPGVDLSIIGNSLQTTSTYLGVLNTLSGGALSGASIMAVGIIPFITSNLVVNLLTMIDEAWMHLRKEGESGKIIIDQYVRQGACMLASIQSLVLVWFLESRGAVIDPGPVFRVCAVISVVSGTMFLIWMTDQISKMGIGRGSSVILCAGILSEVPSASFAIVDSLRIGSIGIITFLSFILFFLGTLIFIVFYESAQRRIPIICPKMTPRLGMQGLDPMYLPMKANVADISPVIFGDVIMNMFMMSFTYLVLIVNYFNFDNYLPTFEWLPLWSHTLGAVILIMIFAMIWAPMSWSPEENAERLNKEAKFIPGVRPGPATVEYLLHLVIKMAIVSGVYLSVLYVMPGAICYLFFESMGFRGMSMLIVVNVIKENIEQISTYILTTHYHKLETAHKKMQSKMFSSRKRGR